MNSKDRVLSIDIGTSTIKCALFDFSGMMTAQSKMSGSVIGTQVLLQVMKNLQKDLGTVKGVCISGNGPTIVPVSRQGESLGEPVLWSDPAAGRPIPGTASLFLPIIRRAYDLNPDAWMYVGCPEFVTGIMTGSWWTFLPSPEFAPYIWSDEEILRYQVPPGRLPPMLSMGAPAGQVTRRYAELSGIIEGTPVYAGGADYLLALLGTGVVEPGLVCDRAGTSEALNLAVDAQYVEAARAQRGIRVLPHTVEGLWSAASLLPPSGMLFLTFLRQSELENQAASQIDEGLFSVLPGETEDLHLVREAYDLALSRRVPSMKASWQRSGRALSEALGFHLRRGLDDLKNIYPGIEGIRISGGQAGSEGWNRLKADILGVPVEIPLYADAELLGCAAVSLAGLNVFNSVGDASKQLYRTGSTIYPDPGRTELYRKRFATLFP